LIKIETLLYVCNRVTSELIKIEKFYHHVERFRRYDCRRPYDWVKCERKFRSSIEVSFLTLYYLFIFLESFCHNIFDFVYRDSFILLNQIIGIHFLSEKWHLITCRLYKFLIILSWRMLIADFLWRHLTSLPFFNSSYFLSHHSNLFFKL
jgi:hypothetical protein